MHLLNLLITSLVSSVHGLYFEYPYLREELSTEVLEPQTHTHEAEKQALPLEQVYIKRPKARVRHPHKNSIADDEVAPTQVHYTSAESRSRWHESVGETRAFLEFLKNVSYDHRQRPEYDHVNGGSNAAVVQVSILVGSIRKVSEVTMDYCLELFFREKWHDPRLNYERHVKKAFVNKTEIGLHESYAAFLWHPDTFLPNAIQSDNPKDSSITHRSLLRLFPHGAVLYSRRISITAECPMDLTMFPFDKQICKLEIESYGYPDTEVIYQWEKRNDPVQWTAMKIKLPDFELQRVVVNTTTGSYATGNYSRLIACFFLARSSGFCFLQLIVPATAVVVASWVALWMENETTFQDMISVILTLTFLIYSYNTVMPRVSYIKAMDVYLGACFAFVFLSLIKLAIVKYMRQRLQIRQDHSIVCSAMPLLAMANPAGGQRANPLQTAIDLEVVGNGDVTYVGAAPNHNGMRPSMGSQNQQRLRYVLCKTRWFSINFDSDCMRKFHLISQIAFPFVFIVFCSIYFMTYPIDHIYDQSICIPN